ncbi:MAG: TauD/TfdA family dioxygenase [bacterium]
MDADGRDNSVEGMEIAPTGKALGAEIRGIDLSREVPGECAEALRAAWAEHLVLLFRDQELTEEQHLAASRIFGELKVGAAKAYYEKQGLKAPGVEGHPEISVISNIGPDGKPAMVTEGLGSGEVVWHSDNSYVEQPPAGSFLYARVLPPEGGNTSFNNQYMAYETLPEELKEKIAGRKAVHDSSRNSAGVLRPGVKLPAKLSEVPGPHHPIVRTHPATGRKALFLGRRRDYPSQSIVGLPEEESERLVDALWTHATREEFVWTHVWRIGDIILWDNRCTMHHREPHAGTHPRILHRTQIAGEIPA